MAASAAIVVFGARAVRRCLPGMPHHSGLFVAFTANDGGLRATG